MNTLSGLAVSPALPERLMLQMLRPEVAADVLPYLAWRSDLPEPMVEACCRPVLPSAAYNLVFIGDHVMVVTPPAQPTPSSTARSLSSPKRSHRRLGVVWIAVIATCAAVVTLVVISRPVAEGPAVEEPRSMNDRDAVASVAVAQVADRPVAVTGGRDGTVRVWDLTTRRPLGGPMTGHTDAVKTVAIAQVDGRGVAVTVDDDNTMRVWELPPIPRQR